jgi:DNA modification methylase
MSVEVINGNCRDVLSWFPSEHFDCVVTSPPYWGLRDYGVDGQLGLEATMQEYIATMVDVFRDVRRVLKSHGTFWLNIGDTYASSWACNRRNVIGSGSLESGKRADRPNRLSGGLKEKDLCMIPNRLAIALQDDGWFVRSEIIWHKPNPMPESVRDRPTNAHEKVWMLTKSDKYFFDREAAKEPGVVPAGTKGAKGGKERFETPGVNARPPEYKIYDGKRNMRNVWQIQTRPFKGAHFATMPVDLAERCISVGCPQGGLVLDPFGGAGTTGVAAINSNRRAVLIELNADYVALATERLGNVVRDRRAVEQRAHSPRGNALGKRRDRVLRADDGCRL